MPLPLLAGKSSACGQVSATSARHALVSEQTLCSVTEATFSELSVVDDREFNVGAKR